KQSYTVIKIDNHKFEIEFEEIHIQLSKRQHLSPEFQAPNPLKKVHTIVDGRYKRFESHAILVYIASAFSGVANHWYPADASRKAKIHSVLDWHHLNLHCGAVVLL
ncbi:glutathione S-transferase T1-like, partial [Vicia villosa]|uniref:glutathione S-transferase T1-like n=1 Tax=Vicia villosa TaxID=3911 RepID=UPI00273CE7E4